MKGKRNPAVIRFMKISLTASLKKMRNRDFMRMLIQTGISVAAAILLLAVIMLVASLSFCPDLAFFPGAEYYIRF